MTNFKNAICRIEVSNTEFEVDAGTGFFISDVLVLTCNHVVKDLRDGENVKLSLKDDSESKYKLKIRAQSEEYDITILEILDSEFKAPMTLGLVNKELNEGEQLKLFGYPNSGQERTTGLEIEGFINTRNEDFSKEVTHDLVLNFETDNKVDHAGFSGSPLLNANNDIVAIFKRQESLSFGGISINRALNFLNENGIDVCNQSVFFEPYCEDLFEHFNPDVKTDCEEELGVVCEEVEPKKIVEEVKEKLFFPNKTNKSISEIIDHIQNNPNCCSNSFWKGWLELLTYVRIVNGNYEKLNNITFDLKYDDLKELFDLQSENILEEHNISKKMNGELHITLSFYFVEEDCFFDVAKKILRQQKKGDSNTCTVFNSHQRNFSRRRFTLAEKSKIIPDVANPVDGGFQVKSKIHLGVLPLDELSDKVANSPSLEEANSKLKELFKDAIK